jgi:hypothetical protein
MRRASIIIAFLMACAPVLAGVETRPAPRLMLTAEYRQDTLDYDNVEKRFFRESVLLSFGKSSASFTHVNMGITRDNRFTWNICLIGLSPYFECIIGNYYAQFGAGLLVGRKMFLSPDFFNRSLAVSAGTPFMPCTAGNPYFSFHGIAAGALISTNAVSLSLHGYYSFRNRFARNDLQYPCVTGTSLNSILNRPKKDYRYSEPVEVNDCGYSFSMQVAGHVTLQSYFIYTFIKRSDDHLLLWNQDNNISPGGEKNFFGYGFYCQYRDDYILIFIDFCSPNRIISAPFTGSRTIRGYGIMYSMAFRHRFCSIYFVGKQTDKNFYTPYSSGNSYPETAFSAAVSVRLLGNLSLGASFYSEKNNLPSGYEHYLRHIRRERLFLNYNARLKGSCTIRVAHVEAGMKKGTDEQFQTNSLARIYIIKSILFTGSGTIQGKVQGPFSGSITARTRFTLFNAATLSLRYSRFFISPGIPLYTAVARLSDSISPGMYVAIPSNILAVMLQVRLHGFRLYFEYMHQFSSQRTIQSRIQASGTCLL